MKRYWLPLAVLLLLGVPLARTGAALVLREVPEKASLNNPLFEALGSAREAAADAIYMRADQYLHAGMDANLLNQIRTAGEDPNHPEFTAPSKTNDWAMRINRQIKIVEHKHLEGEDAKEILPLLYVSSTLNPQNVDAALTAAYWLEKSTGNAQKSLEVLRHAESVHPDDWRILFAIAQILDAKKKDPAGAIPYYQKTANFLTPQNALPFDWIRVRYAWAEALAATGQNDWAIAIYEEALKLAEQREKTAMPAILRQKIAKLRELQASSGQGSPESRADAGGSSSVEPADPPVPVVETLGMAVETPTFTAEDPVE